MRSVLLPQVQLVFKAKAFVPCEDSPQVQTGLKLKLPLLSKGIRVGSNIIYEGLESQQVGKTPKVGV